MGRPHATLRTRSGAGPFAAREVSPGWLGFTILAIAGIGTLHAALTWGYTTLWYTDSGGWLSHVERVSQGAVLYRDVGDVMPPFSVWILSLWGAVFGTDAIPLLAGCVVVFGGLVVMHGAYCASVIPRRFAELAIPIGAAALVLALGNAPMLASGSYHPAVPIGYLLLVTALLLRLRGSDHTPALLGLLAGLVALTKQDYWVPAAVLVVWESWASRNTPRRMLVAPVVAAVTFSMGIALVGLQAGWSWVIPAFTGSGAIGDSHGIGRQAPSWERIVVELGSLAGSAAVALALLRRFGRGSGKVLGASVVALAILGAIYIAAALNVAADIRSHGLGAWPTEFAGSLAWDAGHSGIIGVVKMAVKMFATEILTLRTPSIFLPFLLLVLVALRWRALDARRTLLAWLLVLAVGLRARRGFEYTDWYQILVEIPVYALALDVLVPNLARRAVAALTICLLALAAGVYWAKGVGPLTQEGAFVSVATERGTVKWPARHPPEYTELSQLLDRFDPKGTVPVFNRGHNGGIAYWTDRRSVTHVWIGMFRSPVPDSLVAQLRRTRPLIAVRPHMYDRARVTEPGPILRTWSLESGPTRYLTDDRAYFDRIVAGCERVEAETGFSVHFCRR